MTKTDTDDIKKEMPDAESDESRSEEDMKENADTADTAEATEAEKTDESKESDGNGESGDADAGEGEPESGEGEKEEDNDTKYLRLMADFQNYKKRVEKEKKDIYSYANEKLVTELLTVMDNFERALRHDGADESFKEGMEMIYKQLSDVLEKAGLTEINALGEDFDPNFHNAVMTEESDEYESGKISGVMQKGYTLNGKVIRPSMVKVVS